MPCGAGGLPEVKPLLLAAMPAVAGEGPGRAGRAGTGNWPAPTATCSKPRSPIAAVLAAGLRRRSMKAVLSPPAVSRPWNVIVCDPAVTVNAAVV